MRVHVDECGCVSIVCRMQKKEGDKRLRAEGKFAFTGQKRRKLMVLVGSCCCIAIKSSRKIIYIDEHGARCSPCYATADSNTYYLFT